MPRRISSHRHPDLFAPKEGPPVSVAVAERKALLPLVGALLTEALDLVARTEASDEDHA
jgi:hypothetical protein